MGGQAVYKVDTIIKNDQNDGWDTSYINNFFTRTTNLIYDVRYNYVACRFTQEFKPLRIWTKFENGQATYQVLVSTINLEEE